MALDITDPTPDHIHLNLCHLFTQPNVHPISQNRTHPFVHNDRFAHTAQDTRALADQDTPQGHSTRCIDLTKQGALGLTEPDATGVLWIG